MQVVCKKNVGAGSSAVAYCKHAVIYRDVRYIGTIHIILEITDAQFGRYLGICNTGNYPYSTRPLPGYIYNTSKLPVLDSAVTSSVYIEYRQLPILNSAVTWAYIIPAITNTQLGRYLGIHNTSHYRYSTRPLPGYKYTDFSFIDCPERVCAAATKNKGEHRANSGCRRHGR